MLKERDAVIRRFILVVDAVVIISAFAIAYYLRERFHIFYTLDFFPSARIVGEDVAFLGQYISFLIVVVPVWIIMLNLLGAYKSIRTSNFFDTLQIIVKAAVYTV
ncbi:MAG: sugar transferase, partial [Candidatus Omnitrophota bacterium]|nr:sugar transferase [Candidatus Omnitrophota bacterium]